MKDDTADTDAAEEADDEPRESASDADASGETEAAAEAPTEPAVDPDEPERPLFAQGWPASPELDRLLAAFERGNYAFVRSEAPKVAASANDAAVKAAALDLRRRIDPAPLAGILVIIAMGLLVVLAGHYLGKHNPGAPPTVAPASTNAPLQPPSSNR
jgi:hypothetical protein